MEDTFVKRHKWNILAFGLFVVIAYAAYYSILNNTLIGDDYALIFVSSRATFDDISPLFQINKVSMRPLAFLILWIQHRVFDLQPLPSHILSVGLHAGVAYMIYWFLGKLSITRFAAFAAALLFMLSPIGPEAVTWSTVRFDILVLLFMLLTLGLYAMFLRTGKASYFLAAVAASAAAIFCKETAITLLVFIPAMDLLFGSVLPETGMQRLNPSGVTARVRSISLRLMPFIGVISVYCTIRYFAIGKFISGYPDVPFIGKPTLGAMKMSTWAIISPLNDFVFGRAAIKGVGILFASIALLSLLVVILRWKANSGLLKRAWLYFVFFAFFSLLPGFHRIFMLGVPQNLRDSRYLYIPMMGFIVFTVLGLIEFGWKNRIWRSFIVGLMVIAVSISFFGLNRNNTAWERTSVISERIPREVRSLLPDPPLNAKLYFLGVPDWSGAYLYVNGLRPAVLWEYDRTDLEIQRIKTFQEFPEGENIYLFVYDEERESVSLDDTART